MSEKTFEETVDEMKSKGFNLAKHFERKEFVDWEETEMIEGVVGEPKIIKSLYENPEREYRKETEIIPVGDNNVNLKGTLKGLEKLVGKEVVIVRDEKHESKSAPGKFYWSFHVFVKS